MGRGVIEDGREAHRHQSRDREKRFSIQSKEGPGGGV